MASAVAGFGVLLIEILRFFGAHKAVQAFLITVFSFGGGGSESKPPEVDVSYQNRVGKSSDWIVVENSVASDERSEVTCVDFTGEDADEPVPSTELERKLPAVLDPGQDMKLMAAHHKGCTPPHDIQVTWEDSAGTEHKVEKTVYR